MCSSVHPTHSDAVDQSAEISVLSAAVPPLSCRSVTEKKKKHDRKRTVCNKEMIILGDFGGGVDILTNMDFSIFY